MIQEPETEKTLDEWMNDVDDVIYRNLFLKSEHLPDQEYAAMHEADFTPEEAYEAIVENLTESF